jgi:peptide deformylase
MRILLYPEPFLRRKAKEVKEITEEMRASIPEMFQTMYLAKGVGLAATQVGIDAAYFVLNMSGEAVDEIVFINPELIEVEGEVLESEGCLSLPGLEAKVRRAGRVRVRAVGLDGEEFEVEGTGYLARALQHEMDHLGGELFIDKVGPAARIGLKSRLEEFEERYKKD